MTLANHIILINSLRLLNLQEYLSTRCSWSWPAAYYYTFIMISTYPILYEYWLYGFNGHHLTFLASETSQFSPHFHNYRNFRSFKCYTWYSLIKGLLRSFQGLIKGRKQWKFSNCLNVYRLWERMSISTCQKVLLAVPVILRSQYGIIICSPNYPGLPEHCLKLNLLLVHGLWKIEWQFIFTAHDKHKRNYELILNPA